MIKRVICVILMLTFMMLTGCNGNGEKGGGDDTVTYEMITQEEAKALMDSEENYVILDVRTEEEFAEKRIAGAILIPYDEIEARAEGELADKAQLILVYCRSGRRSKIAAETLAKLGYTNVKEFGGINDWSYGTES